MKPSVLTLSLVAIGLASTAFAASPKANLSSIKAQMRSEIRSEGRAPAVSNSRPGVSRVMKDKSSSDPPGGGDPDTFGGNVIWDGLLSSGSITLSTDCTPVPGDPAPGPDDHCVTMNPAPASTSFDLPDIGRMTLPGKSSRNILCHWLTPIVYYSMYNGTGVPANGRIRLVPYLDVESSVLNNPSLIDPTTGLPFGGKLQTGFSATYQNSHTLQPNESDTQQFSESRVCIGGTVSRQGLIQGYGLTSSQVDDFFKNPITLRLGLRGSASLINYGYLIYGLRIMGDDANNKGKGGKGD